MLPIELIREIAAVDCKTYSALVRALPPLARWCSANSDWAQNQFKFIDKYGFTYLNGRFHSFDDKPALYNAYFQLWYKFGRPHRAGDEPAEISSNGAKVWYKNGIRHRENDQPAVINADGTLEWWIYGKKIK